MRHGERMNLWDNREGTKTTLEFLACELLNDRHLCPLPNIATSIKYVVSKLYGRLKLS